MIIIIKTFMRIPIMLRIPKISLFFIVLCFGHNLLRCEISKQRLDELAAWFADGMQAYEKSQPKSATIPPVTTDRFTQSEAHMRFVAQNTQELFPLRPNLLKTNPPPGVTTVQDLRNNEDKLIEWMLSITSWPGVSISLQQYTPLIKKILTKERAFSSDYVFYHGYKRELGLVFDLYREINNFLLYATTIFGSKKNQPIVQKVIIRDIKYQPSVFPYKNINDFIDHWENFFLKKSVEYSSETRKNNPWDDHLDELRASMISTNIALFGQTKAGYKESTLYFFLMSQNVLPINFLDDIFKRWNFDEKYKNELEQLYSNFMSSDTGHLAQIFIPADKVDSYAYISMAYGTPVRFKISDTFKEKFVEDHGTKINLSRHMDIKSVLDVFRTRPETIKSPLYKSHWGDYYRDADDLQARIVFDPSFFSPNNGIKIFRYTTTGLEKEFSADYKKGLRIIVGKMMISYILQQEKEIEKSHDVSMKKILQNIMQWDEQKPQASTSTHAK